MMYPTNNRRLVLAEIISVVDSVSVTYEACRDCYTKLVHQAEQQRWICLKCGQVYSHEMINIRYRVALRITDSTTTCSATVFGKMLDSCFGSSAREFKRQSEDVRRKLPGDASYLIQEAMNRTFMGQMFYFGFKAPAAKCTKDNKGVTLSEVVRSNNANASHVYQSKDEGIVAYQMIPACKDTKENRSTVISMLGHLVDLHNRRDNMTLTQESVLSSGRSVLEHTWNSSSRSSGANFTSRTDSSCDNQSSLALSCDSIKDSVLHQTSYSGFSDKSLQFSLKHDPKGSTECVTSTGAAHNADASSGDETVDFSIEQFRAGSVSLMLPPGGSQMTLSIMNGVDFDETLDNSGDLCVNKCSQLSVIPHHEVYETAEADCSSILIMPLADPFHSQHQHGESQSKATSEQASSTTLGLIQAGSQSLNARNQSSNTRNQSSKTINHSSNTENQSIKTRNQSSRTGNQSSIIPNELNSSNHISIREVNILKTNDESETWATMPESEDLDQFLRDLEHKEAENNESSMSKTLQNRIINGRKQNDLVDVNRSFANTNILANDLHRLNGSVDADVKISLLSEAPYSEDLNAFLQDLEDNETFDDIPQIPSHRIVPARLPGIADINGTGEKSDQPHQSVQVEYDSTVSEASDDSATSNDHEPNCSSKSSELSIPVFDVSFTDNMNNDASTNTGIPHSRISSNSFHEQSLDTDQEQFENNQSFQSSQMSRYVDEANNEKRQEVDDGHHAHSRYSESLFGDSLVDISTTSRRSSVIDGSCDMFDQSEDLFDTTNNSTKSDYPAVSSTDCSIEFASFLSVRATKNSLNNVECLQKTVGVYEPGQCNKRKSVHFPSSSKLTEAENISSIDRQMKVNAEVCAPSLCTSMLPEKSCLRRSEIIIVNDDNCQPQDTVTKQRSIADLFTVGETPIRCSINSSLNADNNASYELEQNTLNISKTLSANGILKSDTSGSVHTVTVEHISPESHITDRSASDNSDSIIAGSQDLFGESPLTCSPPCKMKFSKDLFRLPQPIKLPNPAVYESTPVSSAPHDCDKRNISTGKKRRSSHTKNTSKKHISHKILDVFSFSSFEGSLDCCNSLIGSQEDLFCDSENENLQSKIAALRIDNSHLNSSLDVDEVKDIKYENRSIDLGDNDNSDESCIGDSQDMFED